MLIEDEIPLVRFEDVQPPVATPTDNKKTKRLAKNRESARNSRKRKKAYLQMLETKVSKLTQELSDLKRD